MKTLISWTAFRNDFIRTAGEETLVNPSGPTYSFYQHFYEQEGFEQHILLSSGKRDELACLLLKKELEEAFECAEITMHTVELKDIINVKEIKTGIETFLASQSEHELYVFISPGTPAMQVAWYLAQSTLPGHLNLLQTRSAKDAGGDQPELFYINTALSSVPNTLIMHQRATHLKGAHDDYKITPSIQPIYDRAALIAATEEVTALILGASGTGKERLAFYIHECSARQSAPYLAINCSAFSDQLLESRLFGFKKGSFTGAEKDTKGIFERAHGGSVFLDEIGDISPYMQQALLRVLQEKEVTPIGGKPIRVNIRIIAATNKDLQAECEKGRFRWDLYYRLAVAELHLPTLQARGVKELQQMIKFFLRSEMVSLKKQQLLTFSKEAQQALLDYSWPGNLRELQHLIRRLYVFQEGQVQLRDLPDHITTDQSPQSLRWEDVEKRHIEHVLRLKHYNQKQTKEALGYGSINTLKKKIKEYGIAIE